jgi:hypothetical protein
VALGAEHEHAIRASIEATVQGRYAEAQRELWTRLLDTVQHFAETMGQDAKVFRDSTVSKLADLARLAPKLSLTPDPTLDALCRDVLKVVQGTSATELRESPTARSEAARKARAALASIERAMEGAF